MIEPNVVMRRFSVTKMFLKFSQNPQGNSCAGVSFLIKLQASSFFSASYFRLYYFLGHITLEYRVLFDWHEVFDL